MSPVTGNIRLGRRLDHGGAWLEAEKRAILAAALPPIPYPLPSTDLLVSLRLAQVQIEPAGQQELTPGRGNKCPLTSRRPVAA